MRSSRKIAAALLALLLTLGNGLLLRFPALWHHPLPMVALFSALGKPGFVLGATALYLAILTTLLAVFQGLREMLPPGLAWREGVTLAGVGGIAMAGFQGIVGVGYLLLGALCLCILGASLSHGKEAGKEKSALFVPVVLLYNTNRNAMQRGLKYAISRKLPGNRPGCTAA